MSGNVSAGILLVVLAVWLFARTWFGGLPRQIAKGITG